MKSNDQLKLDLIKYRGEGHSYKSIADKLDVSKPTVMKWSRELAVEISNQKKLEYEAFLVSLDITRENRAKRLKAISDKLEAELEKRDFADMPTGKLIEQLLKAYGCWGLEASETEFQAKPLLDLGCLDGDFFNRDKD